MKKKKERRKQFFFFFFFLPCVFYSSVDGFTFVWKDSLSHSAVLITAGIIWASHLASSHLINCLG